MNCICKADWTDGTGLCEECGLVRIQPDSYDPFEVITHDDWELLAVCDLAPYHDPRYEGEEMGGTMTYYQLEARGNEVLSELHKMLFGKTVEECGCNGDGE